MCQVLGSVSEEISSKMSVAELQSYEHNGMVSGQICDIVIGQSESSKKMCTDKDGVQWGEQGVGRKGPESD